MPAILTHQGFQDNGAVWGVVGMLVGEIIAAQLTFSELNVGVPWFSYGRFRRLGLVCAVPCHVHALFGGRAGKIIAGHTAVPADAGCGFTANNDYFR